MNEMWRRLPPEVQDRIDDELRRGREIHAIRLLRDEGGLNPKPRIPDAMDAIVARLAHLKDVSPT